MTPSAGLRPSTLEVTPKRWMRWLWLPVAFTVLAIGLWWLGHPQDLGADDRTVTASATVGRTVYLGVTDTSQADRTITLTEVRIPQPEGSPASVKALVCVNGSIAQTTDATRFCSELADPKDHELRIGVDQLILSVTAEEATRVELDRLSVSFRDGLQRGDSAVGPRFAITFVG